MTDARSQAQNRRPKATWLAFLRDETAASAVFFALTIASTIGLVGLGAESGLWFSERRQYQTAADAGAIAGAWQMATQLTAGSGASLDTTSAGSAWKETVRNGATDSADNIAVSQLSSPTRARVVVTQPKSALLSASYLPSGVTIVTAAEASVESLGKPCINALGTTGTDVSFQGNPSLDAPNCILTSNSTDGCSVSAGGTPDITVKQIYTAGGSCVNGTPTMNVPSTGVGTTADPFKNLSVGTAPGCTPWDDTTPTSLGTAGAATTLCKNKSKNQTGTVKLQGGMTAGVCTSWWTLNGTIYIVNGDFDISSLACVKSGASGVTIILTGSPSSQIGSISIASNSSVNLSAPTSGTYSGIVFFQDRNAPASGNGGQHVNSFSGGSSTTITGAIYTPAETVAFGGNNGSTCTVIIANAVTFTGTSDLTTDGCKDAGLTINDVYTVTLSE